MGHVSMGVIGMDDVLKMLDLDDKLDRAAPKALEAGAQIVLEAAKADPPVRSGELKRALKVGKRKKTKNRYARDVGTFYPEAAHAHLVEHGHGGPKPAPAHPFLQPAADSVSDQVTEAIMAELMRGLDEL